MGKTLSADVAVHTYCRRHGSFSVPNKTVSMFTKLLYSTVHICRQEHSSLVSRLRGRGGERVPGLQCLRMCLTIAKVAELEVCTNMTIDGSREEP